MMQPFTPAQSSEINDRIVAMIAAALGEGPQARRARAIANERWLEREAQPEPPAPSGLASTLEPIASAPRDAFILAHCPDAGRCETWPMAPWIMAKWNRDTDCWRDQQGIEIAPTHWMSLDAIDLGILPPEGSGGPHTAQCQVEAEPTPPSDAIEHCPAGTTARQHVINAARGVIATLDAIAADEVLLPRSGEPTAPQAGGGRLRASEQHAEPRPTGRGVH